MKFMFYNAPPQATPQVKRIYETPQLHDQLHAKHTVLKSTLFFNMVDRLFVMLVEIVL